MTPHGCPGSCEAEDRDVEADRSSARLAPMVSMDRLGLEAIRDRHANPDRYRCALRPLALLTTNDISPVVDPHELGLVARLMVPHGPEGIVPQ